MGPVYAGLLRAAGIEVWTIDTIRANALRVEGASGDSRKPGGTGEVGVEHAQRPAPLFVQISRDL